MPGDKTDVSADPEPAKPEWMDNTDHMAKVMVHGRTVTPAQQQTILDLLQKGASFTGI